MQWSKFESRLLHEFTILADLRQCHKTFLFVADAGTKQASVFVSGKFFRAYFRYKFNTNIQNQKQYEARHCHCGALKSIKMA
jgi:hypothetical protein